MSASGSLIFDSDAAHDFLDELRGAKPTAVGDLISTALRKVSQAEGQLKADDVQDSLVAVALLLSEFDTDILDGAADPERLGSWFAELEIELNPARRQVAGGALDRILLPADNEWYDMHSSGDDAPEAIATVHRLQDLLADSADLE